MTNVITAYKLLLSTLGFNFLYYIYTYMYVECTYTYTSVKEEWPTAANCPPGGRGRRI